MQPLSGFYVVKRRSLPGMKLVDLASQESSEPPEHQWWEGCSVKRERDSDRDEAEPQDHPCRQTGLNSGWRGEARW